MRMSLNVKTELDEEKIRDTAREVLYRAMHEMHDIAVELVPVDTGRLKGSIHLDPIVPGMDRYSLADGVDYGVHVEYGTSPHEITPKTKGALAFEWTEAGGKMVGKKGRRGAGIAKTKATTAIFKKVMHPGTTARPFMRPSLDRVRQMLPRIWKEVTGT